MPHYLITFPDFPDFINKITFIKEVRSGFGFDLIHSRDMIEQGLIVNEKLLPHAICVLEQMMHKAGCPQPMRVKSHIINRKREPIVLLDKMNTTCGSFATGLFSINDGHND